MVNASEAKHRIWSGEIFSELFDNYIHSDQYDPDFIKNLKWISQINPEDQSFSLISWQVATTDGSYDYHAYLFLPSGEKIKFNYKPQDFNHIESMALQYDEWYGSLY